jgi:hypothetical protein
MLQKQTVSHTLLKVLNKWMSEPLLSNYRLVGGTGLSLLYGHRQSIDIDLFTNKKITDDVRQLITLNKGLEIINDSQYHLAFFEEEIKVDFAHFDIDFLPNKEIEGVRIADPLDIFGMKLYAITGRTVKKDFYDIAELIYQMPFSKGYEYFISKYPSYSKSTIILNAFGRMDDVDSSPDPVVLFGQTWEGVKEYIKFEVNRYFAKKWR